MNANPFICEVEQVPPKAVVVRISGVLSMETAEPLQDRLGMISCPRAGTLVVDLSAVQFVSVTALGILIALHRRLKLRGGAKLRLAGLDRPMEQMLRSMCRDQTLETFPAVDEAIASADRPAATRIVVASPLARVHAT